MYEVTTTFYSRKSGKLLPKGITLESDYYTAEEAEEALRLGLIQEIKTTRKAKK